MIEKKQDVVSHENTKSKIQKVLILAGGTGGHVFPGLALAEYLEQKKIQVDWIGTEKGIEFRLLPPKGIPLHTITITGLRGKGILSLIKAPFKLLFALYQSLKIISRIKPDIVIGMGGFVSGPSGFASFLLGYPLIIHEQNAKVGLTNKLLSYVTKKNLAGFPHAFAEGIKTVYTGNPVRSKIMNLSPLRSIKNKNSFHLLVLGGSLGAQAINSILPEVSKHLSSEMQLNIIHQTGEKDFLRTQQHYESLKLYQSNNRHCENANHQSEAIKSRYGSSQSRDNDGALGVNIRIEAFIENMDEAYAWADIVLCRAGALTVAELCAAGVGAIFVPYPFAVDDHQTANANFMVHHKAAICIPQKELDIQKMINLIKTLSADPEICKRMGEAAFKLRKEDVVEKIFAICEEVVL